MYNYGGGYGSSCGCGGYSAAPAAVPYYPCGGYNNNASSNYAIILVLFILLVIVIGSRWAR